MTTEAIYGHCAVIINPAGAVVAQATDFDGAYAAGISRESQQTYRVRHRVMRAFARGHLNQWLAEKVDDEFAGRFFEHASSCGYKMHVFQVGVDHAD